MTIEEGRDLSREWLGIMERLQNHFERGQPSRCPLCQSFMARQRVFHHLRAICGETRGLSVSGQNLLVYVWKMARVVGKALPGGEHRNVAEGVVASINLMIPSQEVYRDGRKWLRVSMFDGSQQVVPLSTFRASCRGRRYLMARRRNLRFLQDVQEPSQPETDVSDDDASTVSVPFQPPSLHPPVISRRKRPASFSVSGNVQAMGKRRRVVTPVSSRRPKQGRGVEGGEETSRKRLRRSSDVEPMDVDEQLQEVDGGALSMEMEVDEMNDDDSSATIEATLLEQMDTTVDASLLDEPDQDMLMAASFRRTRRRRRRRRISIDDSTVTESSGFSETDHERVSRKKRRVVISQGAQRGMEQSGVMTFRRGYSFRELVWRDDVQTRETSGGGGRRPLCIVDEARRFLARYYDEGTKASYKSHLTTLFRFVLEAQLGCSSYPSREDIALFHERIPSIMTVFYDLENVSDFIKWLEDRGGSHSHLRNVLNVVRQLVHMVRMESSSLSTRHYLDAVKEMLHDRRRVAGRMASKVNQMKKTDTYLRSVNKDLSLKEFQEITSRTTEMAITIIDDYVRQRKEDPHEEPSRWDLYRFQFYLVFIMSGALAYQRRGFYESLCLGRNFIQDHQGNWYYQGVPELPDLKSQNVNLPFRRYAFPAYLNPFFLFQTKVVRPYLLSDAHRPMVHHGTKGTMYEGINDDALLVTMNSGKPLAMNPRILQGWVGRIIHSITGKTLSLLDVRRVYSKAAYEAIVRGKVTAMEAIDELGYYLGHTRGTQLLYYSTTSERLTGEDRARRHPETAFLRQGAVSVSKDLQQQLVDLVENRGGTRSSRASSKTEKKVVVVHEQEEGSEKDLESPVVVSEQVKSTPSPLRRTPSTTATSPPATLTPSTPRMPMIKSFARTSRNLQQELQHLAEEMDDDNEYSDDEDSIVGSSQVLPKSFETVESDVVDDDDDEVEVETEVDDVDGSDEVDEATEEEDDDDDDSIENKQLWVSKTATVKVESRKPREATLGIHNPFRGFRDNSSVIDSILFLLWQLLVHDERRLEMQHPLRLLATIKEEDKQSRGSILDLIEDDLFAHTIRPELLRPRGRLQDVFDAWSAFQYRYWELRWWTSGRIVVDGRFESFHCDSCQSIKGQQQQRQQPSSSNRPWTLDVAMWGESQWWEDVRDPDPLSTIVQRGVVRYLGRCDVHDRELLKGPTKYFVEDAPEVMTFRLPRGTLSMIVSKIRREHWFFGFSYRLRGYVQLSLRTQAGHATARASLEVDGREMVIEYDDRLDEYRTVSMSTWYRIEKADEKNVLLFYERIDPYAMFRQRVERSRSLTWTLTTEVMLSRSIKVPSWENNCCGFSAIGEALGHLLRCYWYYVEVLTVDEDYKSPWYDFIRDITRPRGSLSYLIIDMVVSTWGGEMHRALEARRAAQLVASRMYPRDFPYNSDGVIASRLAEEVFGGAPSMLRGLYEIRGRVTSRDCGHVEKEDRRVTTILSPSDQDRNFLEGLRAVASRCVRCNSRSRKETLDLEVEPPLFLVTDPPMERVDDRLRFIRPVPAFAMLDLQGYKAVAVVFGDGRHFWTRVVMPDDDLSILTLDDMKDVVEEGGMMDDLRGEVVLVIWSKYDLNDDDEKNEKGRR